MGEKKEKEEKKQGKGKKIAIIVLVIIIAISIGIFALINYHKTQLELLNQEAQKITELQITAEDGTIAENVSVDMDIKTTGQYAIVEETLKQYLNQALELAKEAENVYETEKIENILSIENIKADGPDFVKTKEKIAKMKQDSENYINEFVELCNPNKLVSAIDDKQVNEYYKEIYRTLALDEETKQELESAIAQMETQRTSINGAFDYLTEIVTFLSDNKSSWQIEGDQIMFKSQSMLDEFNELIENAPVE